MAHFTRIHPFFSLKISTLLDVQFLKLLPVLLTLLFFNKNILFFFLLLLYKEHIFLYFIIRTSLFFNKNIASIYLAALKAFNFIEFCEGSKVTCILQLQMGSQVRCGLLPLGMHFVSQISSFLSQHPLLWTILSAFPWRILNSGAVLS